MTNNHVELTRILHNVIGNLQHIDRTIIKPDSFILSQFTDQPYYYTKKREGLANSIKAYLLNPLPDYLQRLSDFEKDDLHYDAEFFPVSPDTAMLIHTTSIAGMKGETIQNPHGGTIRLEPMGQYIWVGYGRAKALPSLETRIKETGLIGSDKKNMATYLKTLDVPETAPCGGGRALFNLHLCIDTKKLLESRNIFYDPETLTSGDEEFRKTFFVFGGIPNQSVTDFKIEAIK